MANYTLDFHQAMDIIMSGGAVKGENFVDGIFLKIGLKGQLVTVDAGRFYVEEPYPFIKGLYRQKFREVTVFTMKELSE